MSGPRLPLQGWIGLDRSGAMAADNPNQQGDVIAVVPPSTYVLPPRLTKERAEDLQIESFAHALGLAVGEHVPWERGSDQDAPDRTITVGGKRMEIELTALTAGKLRAERQRLSDVAQQVRDEIAGMADLSAALSGWTVDLSDAADRPMPTKSGAPTTAARITSLLTDRAAPSPPRDNGAAAAVKDVLEGTRGISRPEVDARHLIDGIQVRLIRHNTTDTRIVTHASQASVTLSEARRILHGRLVDKNSKMRENVVVRAGDPDRDSVIVPHDVAAFELLTLFGFGELPPVPKVKRAWLHLTGTTELIPLICRDKTELPDRGIECCQLTPRRLLTAPCLG